MPTLDVTDASFAAEVLASPEPILVDFWATWCAPCKAMAPALDEIADEMAGRVRIAKLEMDANPESAARWGVRSAPTLILFQGGEPIAIRVGASPKGALTSWIASAVA